MGSMIVLQEREPPISQPESSCPAAESSLPTADESALRADTSSPIDDVTPVQSFTADLPTPVQSALYSIDQIDRQIREQESQLERQDTEKTEDELNAEGTVQILYLTRTFFNKHF